ncbi:serine--tRNA ligase [soil metagenome]
MLDLKAIREDPEPYRKELARRGASEALDEVLALDERRREVTARVEALRAAQNRGSKEIAAASSQDERQAVIDRLRSVSAELEDLEPGLTGIEERLNEAASQLPNVPHATVPDGRGEEDNEVLHVGPASPRVFDFEPRDHVAIGQALGMLELERGVRASGARFAYLTGDAVLIQFALMQYALEFAIPRGFVPVVPPVLVRREAMYGTGFLPSGEEQIYVTRDDDLYLVGTSEVPLAALHAGEILEPEQLPRRYLGYSTCFRREAGTYGKDTRGIFRLHQFDKLEMFSFVLPDESWEEHERILALEEEWVQSLGIPYRVVNCCTGELSASNAKRYDIEAWFPGQERYREITSASNTTDFQARRLECRVRLPEGNRPVHTLNGTLCAIGRTLIALLENGQRADGSVELPEVLQRYLPAPG